jgi:putative methyltransferase
VDARCADFLSVAPSADPALAAATSILLDPSCSGSGTAVAGVDAELAAILAVGGGDDDAGRPSEEAARQPSDRVARLASFQLAALRHALSSFPAVRRVAYSTCSVHAAENEAVVAAALDGGGGAPPARDAGWRLAHALPAWPRRGIAGAGLSEAEAGRVVRADPATDETDGFFVAVLEREGLE